MIRLLVTAGRGPAECRVAVVNTLAAMAREADASGLGLDVAAGPDSDGHGPASRSRWSPGPAPRCLRRGGAAPFNGPPKARCVRCTSAGTGSSRSWCFRWRALARRRLSIGARSVSKRSGRAAPAVSTRTRPSPPCALCMCRAVLQSWRGTPARSIETRQSRWNGWRRCCGRRRTSPRPPTNARSIRIMTDWSGGTRSGASGAERSRPGNSEHVAQPAAAAVYRGREPLPLDGLFGRLVQVRRLRAHCRGDDA